MARYINEDEFIAWVKEHWCADCQNDNGLRCRACWIDDAIDIVEEAPAADVVPKSEEGAECPTCHGTGRIGTTDWLTKGLSKKQIAEEKAKAVVEHEQHIKTEIAREIFEEFRAQMRSLIDAANELYHEDPDDFYGGQTWAYSSAIAVLEKIIRRCIGEQK